jgi:hypothetical protein
MENELASTLVILPKRSAGRLAIVVSRPEKPHLLAEHRPMTRGEQKRTSWLFAHPERHFSVSLGNRTVHIHQARYMIDSRLEECGVNMRQTAITMLMTFLGIVPALHANDAQEFDDYMNYSKDVAAKYPLIVYARIDSEKQNQKQNRKQKTIEFRYDHYPEIERIQIEEQSFIRKRGGTWIKSEDWGKTGKQKVPSVSKDFDGWIVLVNAPLSDAHEPRDKSQGSVVPERIEGANDGTTDEVVFQMQARHSTGMPFPRFTFTTFGRKALIRRFSGPLSFEGSRVMARFQYDFVLPEDMEETTPTPPPATPPSGAKGWTGGVT